jgi:hypothetical protein
MESVQRLRAMGSLCRQQAAYRPDRAWKLLAEAEYRELLAERALAFHFRECNTTSSRDQAKIGASPNAHETRWETVAANRNSLSDGTHLQALH